MVSSPTGMLPAVALDLSKYITPPVATTLVLEITRGRTRFPRRPVTASRFLIGAGVTCDLRLGGEGMPALHSLIVRDEGGIHLEAIAQSPTLIVNGRGVHEAELCDGDVIGIGELELTARLSDGDAPAGVQTAVTTQAETIDRPLSELSAVDLINRIESEERLMEQLESGRKTGARALTQAVRERLAAPPVQQRTVVPRRIAIPAPHFLSKRPQVLAARGRPERTAETPTVPADGPVFLQEMEQLGRQLTALSHEMKTRTERTAERESHYAEASDLLMETQQKLASQLETLLSQVATMKDHSAAPRSRAIA